MLLIQENISLASFCWLKVGGVACYYCKPESIEEIQKACEWAKKKRQTIFVLGNGSNVVFSDQGFDGLVIHTKPLFTQFSFEANQVICDSGALIYKVVQASIKKGLGGIESLIGIPGTLGGAVFINAGAYGQQFSDTIDSVLSCNEEGEFIERNNVECKMQYRDSIFTSLRETILQVRLKLKSDSLDKLQEKMKLALSRRKSTQPLNFPNVGSIFKKFVGISAGKIIEDTGLKGEQIGGAQISEKHANFIINTGDATAQNVSDLVELVQERVFQKKQIKLELEARFIGSF